MKKPTLAEWKRLNRKFNIKRILKGLERLKLETEDVSKTVWNTFDKTDMEVDDNDDATDETEAATARTDEHTEAEKVDRAR